MNSFICGPRIYEFEGWVFEYGRTGGPWPHRKDGEMRKRAGKGFYEMFQRWAELPNPESYRVGGGCREVG